MENYVSLLIYSVFFLYWAVARIISYTLLLPFIMIGNIFTFILRIIWRYEFVNVTKNNDLTLTQPNYLFFVCVIHYSHSFNELTFIFVWECTSLANAD